MNKEKTLTDIVKKGAVMFHKDKDIRFYEIGDNKYIVNHKDKIIYKYHVSDAKLRKENDK